MIFLGGIKSSAFQKQCQQFTVLAMVALVLFFMPTLRDSQAAFELNFDPTLTVDHSYASSFGATNYSCGMAFGPDFNCSSGFGGAFDLPGSHDDGSAAYQRIFTSGGKTYYHVIIGNSTTDTFYMEYMIEASMGWGVLYNQPASASAYTNVNDFNCNNTDTDCLFNMANPYSANSNLGGTGSANPNRVVMRMILDDGITYNEFLKGASNGGDSSAYFDKKPLIIQRVNEPGVVSVEFSMDMRDKTYSDSTPVSEAQMTNRTFILEGTTAANQGDYDSTGAVQTPTNMTDSSGMSINGGAFTYTTGPSFGGSLGNYTYYESDGVTPGATQTQPINRDYSVFCKPDENVDWSGNGACTNADASGGGYGGGGGGWGGW